MEDVPENEKEYIELNRAFFDGKSSAELERLRMFP